MVLGRLYLATIIANLEIAKMSRVPAAGLPNVMFMSGQQKWGSLTSDRHSFGRRQGLRMASTSCWSTMTSKDWFKYLVRKLYEYRHYVESSQRA